MMESILLTLALAGSLSGYHLRPTQGTVAIRQTWGQLPQDLSQYDVMVAVPDCGAIGWDGTMTVDGEVYRAIVFDCAGPDAHDWMIQNGIAAEVDWWWWVDHPELVGTMAQASLSLSPRTGEDSVLTES